MALLHAAPVVTASIGKDPHAGGSGVTVLGGAVEQFQADKPAAERQVGPSCPTLLAGPMVLQQVTGTLPVA